MIDNLGVFLLCIHLHSECRSINRIKWETNDRSITSQAWKTLLKPAKT